MKQTRTTDLFTFQFHKQIFNGFNNTEHTVTCTNYKCSDSAVTRLYNPLGGADYRSYGCALLCRDSRLRPLAVGCVAPSYLCRLLRMACIAAYYLISEETQRVSCCVYSYYWSSLIFLIVYLLSTCSVYRTAVL